MALWGLTRDPCRLYSYPKPSGYECPRRWTTHLIIPIMWSWSSWNSLTPWLLPWIWTTHPPNTRSSVIIQKASSPIFYSLALFAYPLSFPTSLFLPLHLPSGLTECSRSLAFPFFTQQCFSFPTNPTFPEGFSELSSDCSLASPCLYHVAQGNLNPESMLLSPPP